MTKPVSMVAYMADIHDGDGASEVILYKEWRFKYSVQSGTGIFQRESRPRPNIFSFCRAEETCARKPKISHIGGSKLPAKKPIMLLTANLKSQRVEKSFD